MARYRIALLFGLAIFVTACDQPNSVDHASANAEDTSATKVHPAPADETSEMQLTATVEHGDNPNHYRFTWESVSPVHLFVSDSPSQTQTDYRQIAQNIEGTTFDWQATEPAQRRYFLVSNKEQNAVKIAVRLLPLEGGRNFRDLGGYPTRDGRYVKWGQVFRSGTMHSLTDADYDYLGDLNIATVCDYRSTQERRAEPTTWRAGATNYLSFPDPTSMAGGDSIAALQLPGATAETVAAAMAKSYSQIAKQHAAAYGEMFDQLAIGKTPLAFNCSAGKDRAGLSAALLLTALGVDEREVVADYALSERYVDYMKEFLGEGASEQSGHDDPYAFLRSLPRSLVAPLMRSDPLYIRTALQDLRDEFGSVMAFIHEELDVSKTELESIRNTLLEYR